MRAASSLCCGRGDRRAGSYRSPARSAWGGSAPWRQSRRSARLQGHLQCGSPSRFGGCARCAFMCTAIFVAGQRTLAARPPNRGAARWLFASRAAVLAMFALGTLAIGFYRLVPEAAPAPEFVPRGLFALLWVVIALKGAGIGKLKPGSAMGLCVTWTKQSRLAWDRGHRALGRILFWGRPGRSRYEPHRRTARLAGDVGRDRRTRRHGRAVRELAHLASRPPSFGGQRRLSLG